MDGVRMEKSAVLRKADKQSHYWCGAMILWLWIGLMPCEVRPQCRPSNHGLILGRSYFGMQDIKFEKAVEDRCESSKFDIAAEIAEIFRIVFHSSGRANEA